MAALLTESVSYVVRCPLAVGNPLNALKKAGHTAAIYTARGKIYKDISIAQDS